MTRTEIVLKRVVRIARDCRTAQKAYFEARKSSHYGAFYIQRALNDAKHHEAELDRALADPYSLITMFDETEEP